jgi:hypothetical protein
MVLETVSRVGTAHELTHTEQQLQQFWIIISISDGSIFGLSILVA